MQTKRQFKDAIYAQIARIGKALSSPKRLELLDVLSNAPKTVEILARETEMSVANVSQHLQTLKEAHLVETSKQGNYVIYRLSDIAVEQLQLQLHHVAEQQLAETQFILRNYFDAQDEVVPLAAEALLDRLQKGDVTVIDVRPEDEFEAGHIPGAVSVPVDDIMNQFESLPRDQQIVAYCRGRYCVYSLQAVNFLREQGFHAIRLEEGLQEWKHAAYPIEQE